MSVSLLIQTHIKIELFKPNEMTATTMGGFRFLRQCMLALRSRFSDFSTFDLIAATY